MLKHIDNMDSSVNEVTQQIEENPMVREPLTFEQAKVLMLSSLGGALEFYDFVIFAVFASAIGKNFFPAENQLLSLIAAFSLFAIGYIVRPLGGIVFSHFGDRIGRRKMFLITISVMATCTLLMAVTPSYQSVGIIGSCLFVVLRMVQGFCIGGEIPGAITFVFEHLKDRAGLACGIVFLFINTGIMLADLIHNAIAQWLPGPQVITYGWRIAFVIGGVLAFVSYYLRTFLAETPMFKEQEREHHLVRIPIATLFREHLRSVIAGICITSLGAAIVSILYLYIVSYLEGIVHFSAVKSTQLPFIGLLVFSLSIAFVGFLSDYIGRKRILLLGACLFVVLSYPFFAGIVQHAPHLLLWFVLAGLIASLITGCYPCLLAEIFPVNVRYSGVAICYNVGFALFGGLSPLVATILIDKTHVVTSPAFVLIFTALLAIVGLGMLQRKLK